MGFSLMPRKEYPADYDVPTARTYNEWNAKVLSQMTDVPDNRRPRWPKIRAIDTTGHTHLSRFYKMGQDFLDTPYCMSKK